MLNGIMLKTLIHNNHVYLDLEKMMQNPSDSMF